MNYELYISKDTKCISICVDSILSITANFELEVVYLKKVLKIPLTHIEDLKFDNKNINYTRIIINYYDDFYLDELVSIILKQYTIIGELE